MKVAIVYKAANKRISSPLPTVEFSGSEKNAYAQALQFIMYNQPIMVVAVRVTNDDGG